MNITLLPLGNLQSHPLNAKIYGAAEPDDALIQSIEAVGVPMSATLAVRENTALAQLENARQMLAGCRDLREVKKIRDIYEAAKVYAKAANLGREAQNSAAEIALLASRKAGEILSQLEKTPKQSAAKKSPANMSADSEYRKTLQETGTSERTAQRWQELSKVPEPVVADYVQESKVNTDVEISAAGLLKKAQRSVSSNQPKPIIVPKNPEKSIAEITARLTVLRSEFSDLNAVTKRIKSTNLNETAKTEVRTLIACLNQISSDAADRAARLVAAMEEHS